MQWKPFAAYSKVHISLHLITMSTIAVSGLWISCDSLESSKNVMNAWWYNGVATLFIVGLLSEMLGKLVSRLSALSVFLWYVKMHQTENHIQRIPLLCVCAWELTSLTNTWALFTYKGEQLSSFPQRENHQAFKQRIHRTKEQKPKMFERKKKK